jgi:SAM-dependent methyltransferase
MEHMGSELRGSIRQQYELERTLAKRILASTPAERATVTRECYEEFHRTNTWHRPRVEDPRNKARKLNHLLSLYGTAASRASDVLELGCGTGELSASLALRYPRTRFTAGDLSEEKIGRTAGLARPNLIFGILPAYPVPFEDGSFDLVISSQLIEHLHPADVPAHFRDVFRLLRPGGLYAFDTPAAVTGPHDISRRFSPVAAGLHLKEWTFAELAALLAELGVTCCSSDVPILGALQQRGVSLGSAFRCGIGIKIRLERGLGIIPSPQVRRAVGLALRVSNMVIYARKAGHSPRAT